MFVRTMLALPRRVTQILLSLTIAREKRGGKNIFSNLHRRYFRSSVKFLRSETIYDILYHS